VPGCLAENTTNGGRGVVGNGGPNGVGVLGQNDTGTAVYGNSRLGIGVMGQSQANIGVAGESQTNDAVHGNSHSTNAAGVSGFNLSTSAPSGPGVLGHSSFGNGVIGDSDHASGVIGVGHDSGQAGVRGQNDAPPAALGDATTAGRGVLGNSLHGIGVLGETVDGVAVYGNGGSGLAGFFNGNVRVTGDIFLFGGDCAEQFDIAESESIEPGTVVVIDQKGALRPSRQAYDKKVAGVVSGAGAYRPGIVLDRQESQEGRASVALVGKVYCKVDSQYAAIEVGDLLTTSATSGHAMKADDSFKVSGCIIGKALRTLKSGRGLIPILVALQ
jgi:hypothetical protein